jgi:AAA15 family ATPase/GTPase
MRIEELTIKNFKSYSNLILKDINKSLNIILGRNGQGKSNIHSGNFSLYKLALHFLLTNKITKVTSQEKRALLNVPALS